MGTIKTWFRGAVASVRAHPVKRLGGGVLGVSSLLGLLGLPADAPTYVRALVEALPAPGWSVAWNLALLAFAVAILFDLNPMPRFQRMLPPGTEHSHQDERVPSNDPEALTQFARAWFLPAWEAARDVAVEVRQRLPQGGIVYELYQMAIIETATRSWRAVQDRVLRSEGTLPLEQLMVQAYEDYEQIVRWNWHMGEDLRYPFSDAPKVAEWDELDRQFMQEFRRLLARTEFHVSALQAVFKKIRDGGVAKAVRKHMKPALKGTEEPQVYVGHHSAVEPFAGQRRDGLVNLSMWMSSAGPVEIQEVSLEVDGSKYIDATWSQESLWPGVTTAWEPSFDLPNMLADSTQTCRLWVKTATGREWHSKSFQMIVPQETSF